MNKSFSQYNTKKTSEYFWLNIILNQVDEDILLGTQYEI